MTIMLGQLAVLSDMETKDIRDSDWCISGASEKIKLTYVNGPVLFVLVVLEPF